jgi:hypothetical protein
MDKKNKHVLRSKRMKDISRSSNNDYSSSTTILSSWSESENAEAIITKMKNLERDINIQLKALSVELSTKMDINIRREKLVSFFNTLNEFIVELSTLATIGFVKATEIGDYHLNRQIKELYNQIDNILKKYKSEYIDEYYNLL